MGTNILDAFVITFGLDASKYHSGEREVRERNKRLRDDSKKTFDDMEKRGKDAASSIKKVRDEVVGLVLVFAGASSVGQFMTNLVSTEASAARLGRTMNMSAKEVIGWRNAMRTVGGSADEADASLRQMEKVIADWTLRGVGPDPVFRALGVNEQDAKAGPEAILLKMASARDRFDPARYADMLKMAGITPSMIALMQEYGAQLDSFVQKKVRDSKVTKEDIDAAMDFQAALADLQILIEGRMRPAITWLIENFSKLSGGGKILAAVAPYVAGGLIAIAVAATAAYWPVAALTVAIGSLIIAYNDWQRLKNMTSDQRAQFEKKGQWLRSRALAQLKDGDITGALGTIGKGFVDRVNGDDSIPGQGRAAQARTPAAAGAGGGIGGAGGDGIEQALIAGGFTAKQARGIRAGIHAEGGSLGMAANGAFGIGQWRGPRAKALFSRFGRNPSLGDQIQFLFWELMGGDHGGASVRSQSTAEGTMTAYLRDFMRPQGKNNEHWIDLVRDIGRGRAFLAKHGGGATTNVRIGTITVNTKATDAAGIARDIGVALSRRTLFMAADGGVRP